MQEQATAERTESLLWIMLSVLMHRCTAGPQHISQIGRLGYGSQWRLPLHGESGAELARVLGGGVVPGSLTLVGGDPGERHILHSAR